MHMKTFAASCLVAVTLSFLATTEVSADPQVHIRQRSATVRVADLDLAREGDARILYERIGHAARAVCRADELSFDSRKGLHRRQCVEAAIAKAVDSADAPLLTAIHLQQREQVARL